MGTTGKIEVLLPDVTSNCSQNVVSFHFLFYFNFIPYFILQFVCRLGTDSAFTPHSHSAAQVNEANLVDTTEDFHLRHFGTTVKGCIFLAKAAEPYLSRGGRIVFISSAGARLGVAGQAVYTATKAADEALVRVWTKELGQSHGLTVNCVNPGQVCITTKAHVT